MIESVTISGYWIVLLAVYFAIVALCNLGRILSPNAHIKRVIKGKSKLHDNYVRFWGYIGLVISIYIVTYLLGWIS